MPRSSTPTNSAYTSFRAGLRGDLHQIHDSLKGTIEGVDRAALELVAALATGGALPEMRAPDIGNPLWSPFVGYQLLAGLLNFELEVVEACASLLNHTGEKEGLWALRGVVWRDFMRGDDVSERAQTLSLEARAHKVAEIQIEATVLRALCADDRDEAVAHARRATRMARSEGLVHHEYLANVVLARTRRASGAPYLAARILAGLAPIVPPIWHRWLDWETALCGANSGSRRPLTGGVREAFRAASAGEGEALKVAFGGLREHLGGFEPLQRELQELRVSLDPRVPAPPSFDWAAGRTTGTWDALGDGGDANGAPHAYVHVPLEGTPRRFVGAAAGLFSEDVVRVHSRQRKDARVMRLAVVLGLAPEGLHKDEAFHRAYGFDYHPKHESSFRVLIHRARQLFGQHADVDRDGESLRLALRTPLLIADPLCARTLGHRVMMLLGGAGKELTPAEVAEALSVSLRQAQRVLKTLSEEGACASDGKRAARYRVEDTTFLEPTRSRVFPAPLVAEPKN